MTKGTAAGVDGADGAATPASYAEVDRNGLLTLDRTECVRLLGQVTFGRIAVTIGALPVILPVNFRLVDERIVFRTSPGSKLVAATAGAVVAFEVDSIDPMSHAGWSVIVTGVAGEVTDPRRLAAIADANVPRWERGSSERIVEIPISMVSGRVLVPGMSWQDHQGSSAGIGLHIGIHVHPSHPLG
jgi:nitroimidazol reductase NimA-like FMN-containing flavoprotein (pyridoxamine 5'-phosphate oxidase superfamily)